jgi:hypothetical protein
VPSESSSLLLMTRRPMEGASDAPSP